jgi:hypothetical protein
MRSSLVAILAIDEKFSGLAYRVGVNYWIYDFTH